MRRSILKTIRSLWPKLVVITAGFDLCGLAVTWHQGDSVEPVCDTESSAAPLITYVVNPGYYAALSDLMYGVVEAINGWKSVSDPVYADFEGGRIGLL